MFWGFVIGELILVAVLTLLLDKKWNEGDGSDLKGLGLIMMFSVGLMALAFGAIDARYSIIWSDGYNDFNVGLMGSGAFLIFLALTSGFVMSKMGKLEDSGVEIGGEKMAPLYVQEGKD